MSKEQRCAPPEGTTLRILRISLWKKVLPASIVIVAESIWKKLHSRGAQPFIHRYIDSIVWKTVKVHMILKKAIEKKKGEEGKENLQTMNLNCPC